MKIQDKITFFHALEAKIWKDEVEANPYLATLSILVVAVSGALVGGSHTLRNWFEWNFYVSMIGTIGACIFLWGYNLAESILASKTALIAILRSLLLLVLMAVAFCLGYAAAVVVITIVTVILFLMALTELIKVAFGSGNNVTVTESGSGVKKTLTNLGAVGEALAGSSLVDSSGKGHKINPDGTSSPVD